MPVLKFGSVNVAASNAISEVEFVGLPGHPVGGSGYDMFTLPIANVVSTNAQAYGANIVVTAVLGRGETLQSVGSTAGAIQQLTIVSGGSGYVSAPTLNLKSIGDGTAQATATIITGAYSYPGRYINDDGHLSSYNFIQDRDYYQTFSYVVKLKQSIEKYRQAMKSLIHPAGMKLYGEYLTQDENANLKINVRSLTNQTLTLSTKNYRLANGNLIINYTNHGLSVGNTVYLDWYTGNVATRGIEKGEFKVRTVVNSNNFTVFTTPYLPTQQNLQSLTGSTSALRDLYFRPDGTKLYVISPTGAFAFDLDRPYDVSMIRYTAGSVSNNFVTETDTQGFTMQPNGSFYYVVGTGIRNIQQYYMTENWNVRTSSIVASLNLQNIGPTQYEIAPTGLAFSPDGKNLYVTGTANDVVFQFNVSVPWQINTANYINKSITVGENAPNGIKFSANGKLMYIVGTGSDTIRMFSLSTAWNVNSAVYNTTSVPITQYNSQFGSPRGIDIMPNGNVFFIIEEQTKSIIQLPTTVTGNANNVYYEINATGTVNVAKTII